MNPLPSVRTGLFQHAGVQEGHSHSSAAHKKVRQKTLTVGYKVLGHVEGDLDGQRARVLRGEDSGHHAGDDGDQGQVDLVQRTGWVACRQRERERERERERGRERK